MSSISPNFTSVWWLIQTSINSFLPMITWSVWLGFWNTRGGISWWRLGRKDPWVGGIVYRNWRVFWREWIVRCIISELVRLLAGKLDKWVGDQWLKEILQPCSPEYIWGYLCFSPDFLKFIESVAEEDRIGAPFRVHFPSFYGFLGWDNVIDEIIEAVYVEIIQAILETMHGTFIYSKNSININHN